MRSSAALEAPGGGGPGGPGGPCPPPYDAVVGVELDRAALPAPVNIEMQPAAATCALVGVLRREASANSPLPRALCAARCASTTCESCQQLSCWRQLHRWGTHQRTYHLHELEKVVPLGNRGVSSTRRADSLDDMRRGRVTRATGHVVPEETLAEFALRVFVDAGGKSDSRSRHVDEAKQGWRLTSGGGKQVGVGDRAPEARKKRVGGVQGPAPCQWSKKAHLQCRGMCSHHSQHIEVRRQFRSRQTI